MFSWGVVHIYFGFGPYLIDGQQGGGVASMGGGSKPKVSCLVRHHLALKNHLCLNDVLVWCHTPVDFILMADQHACLEKAAFLCCHHLNCCLTNTPELTSDRGVTRNRQSEPLLTFLLITNLHWVNPPGDGCSFAADVGYLLGVGCYVKPFSRVNLCPTLF